jgi:hypothetical protein
MTARIVTVVSPEDLRALPESQARSAAHPLDDLVASAIAHELILAAAPTQPAALQAELAAMGQLSDAALCEIAGSMVSSDTIALYELLTERQRDGQLNAQGRQWLAQVCEETRTLMLRKAHANALLKRRGHR